MKGVDIGEYYREAKESAELQIQQQERLINIYSFLRLSWIVISIFLFYQSFKLEIPIIWELTLLVIIIVFGLLVRKQTLYEKKKNHFISLSRVVANELKSMQSAENIYPDGEVWRDAAHPYTSDLDVFGNGSIFNMINRCSTADGNSKLAQWLQRPAPTPEVRARQSAVKEIASKLNWRLNFQALLLSFNKGGDADAGKLLSFMSQPVKAHPQWIVLYIRWIPIVFGSLFIAAFWLPLLFVLVGLLGVFNLLLERFYFARIFQTVEKMGNVKRTLESFSDGIDAVKNENWESDLCKALTHQFHVGENISRQLKRLSFLISNLTLPYLISFPLSVMMVWPVRYLFLIDKWKQESGDSVQEGFDVIASFEALASLSSLTNNNPDWIFPEIIDEGLYTLEAKAIGHPLISKERRIRNDFSLKNELKIDIITGSNMAGKSTFLRTLGLNTVFALAGAPVCATEMSVSNMLIFSYMRIADSLNENTSTFKAELDRLKHLLEMLDLPGRVYFLIDEMLRGTNSVDKYLGSKAIIEKLISQKGVGIVATHDLQLAELEKTHPAYVRNFYFDIQVDGNEMVFDYKLKAGECKTFNASLLLRQLGIFTE